MAPQRTGHARQYLDRSRQRRCPQAPAKVTPSLFCLVPAFHVKQRAAFARRAAPLAAKTKPDGLTPPPARGIMNAERAPRQAGSAPCTGYKLKPMNPSLGRVAGSTFYSDRHCPKENMKRQCNRHDLTPSRVVWLNPPAACFWCPAPVGQSHSTAKGYILSNPVPGAEPVFHVKQKTAERRPIRWFHVKHTCIPHGMLL